MSDEGDFEDLDETAATWLIRRADTESWSSADRVALEEWLEESPDHRVAFEAAKRAHSVLFSEKILSEGEVKRLLSKSKKGRPVDRPAFWGAMAAAAAVIVLAFLMIPKSPQTPTPNVYSSGVGELRAVTLPDGTQVNLDSDTRLEWLLDDAQRQVTLLSGAAVFEIAEDPKRPFEVHAGNYSVRDIGTTFSVRMVKNLGGRETRLEVAVEEGIVDLSEKSSEGSPRVVRLLEGELAVWAESADKPEVEAFDPADFAAWRERRLLYRDRPLGEVLADLQRYHGLSIRFVDSSVSDLSVSGTLRTDDLNSALSVIEAVLPVEFDWEGKGQVSVRKLRQ